MNGSVEPVDCMMGALLTSAPSWNARATNVAAGGVPIAERSVPLIVKLSPGILAPSIAASVTGKE